MAKEQPVLYSTEPGKYWSHCYPELMNKVLCSLYFFSDLYPMLMDRMQQLCNQRVNNVDMTVPQRLAACALIGVLETATSVAADASRMASEQRQK